MIREGYVNATALGKSGALPEREANLQLRVHDIRVRSLSGAMQRMSFVFTQFGNFVSAECASFVLADLFLFREHTRAL